MIWYIAFITGLAGSLHCVGMCGPIALALPVHGKTVAGKITGRVLYNLGRIITYSMLGFVLGSFGFGLKLAGMQQSISIAAGVLILLTGFFTTGWLEKRIGSPFRWLGSGVVQKLFRSPGKASLLLIGMLNGLLPCGFVYVALVASVATQQPLHGALFMTLFGLGTFPLMLGVSLAGQFISAKKRAFVNKLTPYIAITIGALFILRGLNLGIPYVSPQISSDNQVVKACCKPSGKTSHAHKP